MLVEEGNAKKEDFPFGTDGYKPATSDFIDGVTYDGKAPNAYIDSLSIGLKSGQKVEGSEIVGG